MIESGYSWGNDRSTGHVLRCTRCGKTLGTQERKDGKEIGDFNKEWEYCPFCGTPLYPECE